MKRYLCTNCGRAFRAARPVCEPCKIDPAANPRFAKAIVEQVTIHFDPPSHVPGAGLYHRACQPDVSGYGGQMATGEPSAVTCETCLETAAWQAAHEVSGEPRIPAEHDEPLVQDETTTG